MLTFEQVKTYFGDEANAHLKHILVEYVQCELLDSLFKQKESVHLSFIGGTAIRIAYGGSRFSEDLDFDNFGLSFEEFSALLDLVVKDMKVKGFLIEFRLVEKDAYHCYIRFPEMLKNAGLSVIPEEKILVRIDTMRKERIFSPQVIILNKFDVYQDILVNPIDIILSQKLITVMERKREKGRDIYDISFLWSKAKPDYSYIERMYGLERDDFVAKFLLRCAELDFDALAKDVEPFLMDVKQANRVTRFLPFIQAELRVL